MGFWYPQLYIFLSVTLSVTILTSILLYYYELADPSFFPVKVLDGRELTSSGLRPSERQLVNIIEEMSIASGLPVPQVYVLPRELGINALALGISPRRSGVCVTEGCLKHLTRDQLQAVVAHEFSHIINGDGKFNAHLLAIFHGVLSISSVGRFLLQKDFRNLGFEGLICAVILHYLGITILVASSPCVFLTLAIQRAISRQREYLADAYAVQFTRHAEGLAEALQKILKYEQNSLISHPSAHQAAHMFFGSVETEQIFSWYSTHPPLLERIRRVSLTKAHDIQNEQRTQAQEAWIEFTDKHKNRSISYKDPHPTINLASAHELLALIPIDIHTACHSPRAAAHVVTSLLLNKKEKDILAQQLWELEQTKLFHKCEVIMIFKEVARLDKQFRLPLLEICLPSLQRLLAAEQKELLQTLSKIIKADQQISFSEYIVSSIVHYSLKPSFQSSPFRSPSSKELQGPLRVLLSFLSHIGHKTRSDAEKAYCRGADRIGLKEPLLTREVCTLPAVTKALNHTVRAIRPLREACMDACFLTVRYDHQFTVEESEMLRLIGLSLDIPIPLATIGIPLKSAEP
jgi:Zn-dependent protease with chaperone function